MTKLMTITDLAPAKGSKRNPKRVGRGPGSGSGKTSGKGHKGQRARSGHSQSPTFEGGQMPLVRRLPKRGFTSIFRVSYKAVNVGNLNAFEAGQEVDIAALRSKGIVDGRKPVKILAGGKKLEKSLTIKAHAFSDAAKAAIEAAGGKAEVLA